jgi:hypothetical protein
MPIYNEKFPFSGYERFYANLNIICRNLLKRRPND